MGSAVAFNRPEAICLELSRVSKGRDNPRAEGESFSIGEDSEGNDSRSGGDAVHKPASNLETCHVRGHSRAVAAGIPFPEVRGIRCMELIDGDKIIGGAAAAHEGLGEIGAGALRRQEIPLVFDQPGVDHHDVNAGARLRHFSRVRVAHRARLLDVHNIENVSIPASDVRQVPRLVVFDGGHEGKALDGLLGARAARRDRHNAVLVR